MDFPSASPVEPDSGAQAEGREDGALAEGRRHVSAIQRRRMKKAGAGAVPDGEASRAGNPSGGPAQPGSSAAEAAPSGGPTPFFPCLVPAKEGILHYDG